MTSLLNLQVSSITTVCKQVSINSQLNRTILCSHDFNLGRAWLSNFWLDTHVTSVWSWLAYGHLKLWLDWTFCLSHQHGWCHIELSWAVTVTPLVWLPPRNQIHYRNVSELLQTSRCMHDLPQLVSAATLTLLPLWSTQTVLGLQTPNAHPPWKKWWGHTPEKHVGWKTG